MIWTKTDAGRTEIQARALVKERAQRNLLLVIDGIKTDEMLLANLAGISAADFTSLQVMGLITPVPASNAVRAGGGAPPPRLETPVVPPGPLGLDYGQFTAALTQLISKELGLRGFVLTLAVEKAASIEDLRNVAQRTIAQIAERKGENAAASARRTLFGN